jgi:hypothetical protein
MSIFIHRSQPTLAALLRMAFDDWSARLLAKPLVGLRPAANLTKRHRQLLVKTDLKGLLSNVGGMKARLINKPDSKNPTLKSASRLCSPAQGLAAYRSRRATPIRRRWDWQSLKRC